MIDILSKRDILILIISVSIYILAQQMASSKLLSSMYALVPNVTQVFASPEQNPTTATLSGTRVENGASSQLRLTLTYPTDGMTIHNYKYELYGITVPHASVTVNGEYIQVKPNGSFNQVVAVDPGQNVIYIVSQTEDGRYSTKRIWLNVENREDNLQINN